MEKRRQFTKQFKEEAVRMASQEGISLIQVSEDLGIGGNMLRRWRKEAIKEGSTALRGQGVTQDEELARLKRELGRVKRERDFFAMRRRTSPRNRCPVSVHSASQGRLSHSAHVPRPASFG